MEKLHIVRARGARWRVTDLQPYDGCTLITLAGGDIWSFGQVRRLLLPFDDVHPVVCTQKPRRRPLRLWRRACRALLASAAPAGCLRSAAGATMDLLPHQLEPALAVLHGLGSRVLLADDVGLGKTVQAGLIVAELLARKSVERALVLAPAGVLEQWARELSQRFGIETVRADSRTLRRLACDLPVGLNPWSTIPLAIASLDYVKRPEVLPAACASPWDIVVVDEAHLVAGDSDRHDAVARLARRASYVVLLSATPHSGDETAFTNLCAVGTVGECDDPLLVFRRTRESVRPDAARCVRVLRVRPSQREMRMFAALARYKRAVGREHGARALALSVLDKRAFSSPWSLAESIDRRLAYLGDNFDRQEQQLTLPLDDVDGELCAEDAPPAWPADLALADAARERKLLADAATAAREAAGRWESKLLVLARLLRRVRESVLIFTEYRDTAAHLQSALGRGLLLHGGIPLPDRQRILSSFSNASHALLIATDAAGQGLNLQHACRVVVNLELPWNPMRLEQRIGRVDRIGQRRRVHAVHLVGRGTGERRILDRLAARVARARAAVGAPDPLGRGGLDVGSGHAENLSRPDVAREAANEARRVAICRSLRRTGDQPVLDALDTAPWWIGKARRTTRRALGGRTVLIVRLSAENELGIAAVSDVLAFASPPMSYRLRDAPSFDGATTHMWFARVTLLEQQFWRRRIDREHAIVRDLAQFQTIFQPALFDRRAERAQADDLSVRQELRARLQLRLLQCRRQATLRPPEARLLLVLTS